jgi:putative transposase
MIRITLDDATRQRLDALRRTDLPARVRDRLEMVALSAAGWSPPRIAAHLGYCGHTVRAVLRGFQARGIAALTPGRSGPPPDRERRDRVTGLLRELLGQPRTWTAGQLAAALAPHGVAIGPRQVRRYLRLLRAGYRRTANSLRHKQDPAEVARAKVVLANLEKKPRPAG